MTVNKLNQLYKPDRLLYYIDASDEDLTRFPEGVIPDEINRYANAFGTYDYPGVFLIKSLDKPVIGIEFRKDDDRIEYPQGLESVEIGEAYFYSIELDSVIKCKPEHQMWCLIEFSYISF